ncbi:MAG: hypothetical protein QXZ25_06245 [Candidatus Bathyarchaeia archaeon]
MLDFLDAVEEGVKAVRQLVMQVKRVYDIDTIKWEKASGASGEYERSEDVDNPNFKALLKDVQAHNGRMTVGDYFVWAFRNGSVLGRKPRKIGERKQ